MNQQDTYLEVNASQRPAVELLKSMGYAYIPPANCELQRGSRYHVLLKDILRGQLRRLNRYSYAGVENEFSAANRRTSSGQWKTWTSRLPTVLSAPARRYTTRCFWGGATRSLSAKANCSVST